MKTFRMHISAKIALTGILGCILSQQICAQQKPEPYYPDRQQVIRSYNRQKTLDSLVKTIPLNANIHASWQHDNSFWYIKRLPAEGQEYYYVNAAKGIKQEAFDQQRLAEAISKLSGKSIAPMKLNINKMFFSTDAKMITFKRDSLWLQCNLNTYQCTKTTDTLHQWYDSSKPLQSRTYRWESVERDSVSPDKKWLAHIKGGNLFIKQVGGNKEEQLTHDGSLDKPYSDVSWSPDGKHIIGYLTNPVEAKKVYFVLSSVPGTTRGQLKSHEYDQPGDPFTTYTPYIFNVEDKGKIKVDADVIDFFGAPAAHWRKGSDRYYTYEKVDRGHQRFRVIEVDVTNGKTRNIIDEKTNTFIYEQRLYTRYLPDSHEIIWITEKDGWRHIYIVNDITGKQKLVTKGNWVVRDIDSVDNKKREIWFSASGINTAEDPYFIHHYRIGFDGNNKVDLTPEKGNHSIVFSPDRKYYLDTYSSVNVAPITLLRKTDDRKTIMEVERTDMGALLATGIKMPEVFVAKGRDGKTDIWGVIYRPADFDPNKRYPVIENVYAGPQDSYVPKSFSPVNEMQSIAQLGFIVVEVDGMGTANRSKAFHDVCWKNIVDGGFPDRILWIKALANKYPQVDTTRVGIYGTSAGGQNSAQAVLFHSDFYKAAVSSCGCHDNRIDKQWWNEQWMGYPVGPHYEQQSNITNAAKLGGSLLLMVGEADENVPPESTFRFADALEKSNKDFDLVVIPGSNHTDGGPYGRRKKRDFFVKHLLNVDAPGREIGEH